MMHEHSKQKRSLKQRLRQATTNISVDVFGYERKATTNIQQYFRKLATQTAIPSQELVIRIFADTAQLHFRIYHKGMLKKTLELQELIEVFTGGYSNFLGLEQKVSKGILELLSQWAERYAISREQVQFCIAVSPSQVWVNVYGMSGYLGELPLKTLIKKFTT